MHLAAAAAIIPADKLRDYLLSSTHPIGRYKSALFRSLGYAQEQWQLLDRDLRTRLKNEAQPSGASEYGQKFAVRGRLSGPNGNSAGIVTIWIILTGQTVPRFVTAYPEE
jgi:hypothetical protein